MSEQTPKICAACGETFTHHGFGRYKDFCSPEHRDIGRSHCLQCDEELTQDGIRRDFCDNKPCRHRYYNWRGPVNPFPLEGLNKCKCGCGGTFIQHEGGRRLFIDKKHKDRYYRAEKRGFDLFQEWGGYLPETRKVLRMLQNTNQMSLAKQLASAIDREYLPRQSAKNTHGTAYIICHCKCGKEFRRQTRGHMSREYCNECLKSGSQRGEKNPMAKLTQEQVDEIRRLYETEHLGYKRLGKKYGVNDENIRHIIKGKTWKPEHDPRRKESTL